MNAASRRIATLALGAAQCLLGCSSNNGSGACVTGLAALGDDGPYDAPNADATGDAGGDATEVDATSDGAAQDGATDVRTDREDAAGTEASTDASGGAHAAVADASVDANVDAPATDTGGGLTDADATVPAVSVSGVRVANWSPDSPSVDFCLAPHGSGAFQGPIVNSLANAGDADGGMAALAFPQVSAYFYVAPGAYDARLVVAGAADCSFGIGSDATMLPALSAGTFATIALLGEAHAVGGAPGLQITGFLDDQRPGGAVALRFIQAAPAISRVDVGTGAASAFAPFFLGVAYGQASSKAEATASDGAAPTVDSNGYATLQPLSGVTFRARASGTAQDLAIASNVSAGAGSVLTLVLVGETADTSSDAGPQGELVECVDNAGTVGPFGNCSVVSQ
jgi:hypothetical protein